MRRPVKPILVLVATMILASVVSVWSGKAICYGFDLGRHSLAGLEGVLVGVKELPQDVEGKGVTKKQIIDDITSQLTKANIKVLTPQESLVSPGAPTLLVNIRLAKITCASKKPSGYLYSAHVGLSQAVSLVRNANVGLHVDTWNAEDLGQISKLNEVTAKIKALIEQFVGSYQAANAKSSFTEPKATPTPKGSKNIQ